MLALPMFYSEISEVYCSSLKLPCFHTAVVGSFTLKKNKGQSSTQNSTGAVSLLTPACGVLAPRGPIGASLSRVL